MIQTIPSQVEEMTFWLVVEVGCPRCTSRIGRQESWSETPRGRTRRLFGLSPPIPRSVKGNLESLFKVVITERKPSVPPLVVSARRGSSEQQLDVR